MRQCDDLAKIRHDSFCIERRKVSILNREPKGGVLNKSMSKGTEEIIEKHIKKTRWERDQKFERKYFLNKRSFIYIP